MERDAIDWTIKFTNVNMLINDDIQAHLLVEVDGNDMDILLRIVKKLRCNGTI